MLVKGNLEPTALSNSESPHAHVHRVTVPPPGVLNPNILEVYGLCNQSEVGHAIETADLTIGTRNLLSGLLLHGGIALFPGSPGSVPGYDVGLDYNYVFKYSYDIQHARAAVVELANVMKGIAVARGITSTKVGVLAPEHSAIKFATLVGSQFAEAYVHSVKKNGSALGEFAVDIDSYTAGRTDTLSLDKTTIELIEKTGQINLFLADDIIDTGAMTTAIWYLLELARRQGFCVNLIGVVSPLEKMYTGARTTIAQALGSVPVHSVLAIEDIGIKPHPWIKVAGMNEAIPCRLTDLR